MDDDVSSFFALGFSLLRVSESGFAATERENTFASLARKERSEDRR